MRSDGRRERTARPMLDDPGACDPVVPSLPLRVVLDRPDDECRPHQWSPSERLAQRLVRVPHCSCCQPEQPVRPEQHDEPKQRLAPAWPPVVGVDHPQAQCANLPGSAPNRDTRVTFTSVVTAMPVTDPTTSGAPTSWVSAPSSERITPQITVPTSSATTLRSVEPNGAAPPLPPTSTSTSPGGPSTTRSSSSNASASDSPEPPLWSSATAASASGRRDSGKRSSSSTSSNGT